MTQRFFHGAFAIGLAAIAWVAAGFIGNNPLAIAMTVAIAIAYGVGAHELRQYRAQTGGLRAAIAAATQPLAALPAWLETVPAGLRQAVRQRIESERTPLPGPALAPYLCGLLVMLGMLGTFLGMVVTFQGAVFALEGSTDLQAIRAALAAPIRGLGLSFGTSVAGVAASAMLGLMSAMARRERQEAGRQLDILAATALRPHTPAHQRQEALAALQAQAQALPRLVEQLESAMARIEARGRDVDEQLLVRHAQFQQEAAQAYTELAQHVGACLQDSLVASARVAADTLRPAVEQTMQGLAQHSRNTLAGLVRVSDDTLAGLARQASETLAGLARQSSETLDGFERQSNGTLDGLARRSNDALAAMRGTLEERAGSVADALERKLAQAQDAHAAREDARAAREAGHAALEQERMQAWTAALSTMAAELDARWDRMARESAAQQAAVATALAQASEQVAAQVGELRQQDSAALQERTLLLERLGELLQSVSQITSDQRKAVEELVASASGALERTAERFTETVQAQAQRADEAGARTTASAIEMASLADAFHQGVAQFQGGNERLVDALQKIEASLVRSTARSDEQLAYYVAQAREVIDLSIASQQGFLEQLRHLPTARGHAAAAEEAEA